MKAGWIVLVEWLDSSSLGHSWGTDDEVRDALPAPCSSVGFVVKHTKKRINLVQSRMSGYADNLITIPMSVVRRIRRIRS